MATGKKGNTAALATQLAQPLLGKLGLILWDVRFEKEGTLWYLRYFIDKEGGIAIQDCEAFSKSVDKLLDEEDFIEQSYTLEVSSPGIERELTRDWHFAQSVGKAVTVRFIRPVEGVREFTGVLSTWENGTGTLLLEDDVEMTFQKSETSFVHLYNDYSAQSYEIDETDEDEGE